MLLSLGPAVQGVKLPGVKAVPSGQAAEDWRTLVLAPPGQLRGQVWPRNLLCGLPAQLERKSLGVSAPSLAAAAFLRGVRGTGPAATSRSRTLRIQGGGAGRDLGDPLGLLAPRWCENRARLAPC